ncbi:hypothetical protein E0H26_01870 [Micromonospora zingiberis]|uniref:Uncharacterized protein n=1 Tax=Micromonospora zingiberis TaxID=2053011 RepID=A0A4R0GS43_9ACTN|nr:hypothetical protein [Micromonospora zingiberis]TCC00461.1 hypothetical protein E0H26_01870 [Micromonospora zingiberis]
MRLTGRMRYAAHASRRTIVDPAEQADRTRRQYLEPSREEVAVAAAFDLSYRDLPAGTRRLLRYLGLHPGPDFDVRAAAALGNLTLVHARRALAELSQRDLIVQRGTRYRIPELIAEHVRRLAVDEPAVLRAAALDRLAQIGPTHHPGRAVAARPGGDD